MRNRAKCKQCNSIIESFMQGDYVSCKCGQIAVNHGPAMFCEALDWNNFLRLDEEDNEKPVTYKEKKQGEDESVNKDEQAHKPTKEELIRILDEMIKSYEHLPQHALMQPVTHADQLSLLIMFSSLFKSH